LRRRHQPSRPPVANDGAGLVRSLAHPGGNTTGVSLLAADLDDKRQEVLFDFFPEGRRIGGARRHQDERGVALSTSGRTR
jgi:hypothetical protein